MMLPEIILCVVMGFIVAVLVVILVDEVGKYLKNRDKETKND